MQKGFAPILVLVGILVLAVVAGGTYYYSKSRIPKAQNQVAQMQPSSQTLENKKANGEVKIDETTGEQLYTNRVLNYSIRFPKNWVVHDYNGSFISIPGEAVFIYPGQNPDSVFSDSIAIFGERDAVKIRLPYEGSFVDAQNDASSQGAGKRIFKIGNFNIAGNPAVQFVHRTLPGDQTETFYSVITWIVYKDINYYFEFSGDEKSIKENLGLYDQILSTFRFTQ